MTAAEFVAALHTLRLTQRDAAVIFRVNERTVRSWVSGKHRPQEGVSIALRLMIKHNETPSTVGAAVGAETPDAPSK